MRRKRITGLNFGGALTVITILITLGLLLMFKSMDLFSGNGKVAGISDFKTVGSSELTNPEYYPVADSNFIAGLSGNNTATPEVTTTTEVSEAEAYTMNAIETTGLVATRTDSFETAYYGFSLTADTPAQLEGIAFQIVKPDNSLSMMYMVEVADDNYDRDGNPITTGISNQYLFKDGVKAIHFYYEGEKSFTVNRYAFENEAKAFAATDVNLETQGINEFKTKLLAAGGLNIIPRSGYGAPPENNFAPGWIPPYYAVNRIVVHHTATSVDMANPANTVRAIWQNHSYTRDWGDIGYNYLIDPFGNIYDGRSGMTGIRGNHAPPNEGSIGISLLGDYSAQVPTQAALDSLAKLVAYLSELNDIPITWRTNYDGISPTDGIYPHRAFNDFVKANYSNWADLVTSCPGEAFMGILPTVMANAQNIKNANTQLPSVVNQYKQVINKENIMRSEGNTEVLVDANKLTAAMKEFLTRPSRRFTLIKEVDGMLLYRVPNDMATEFFIELNITAREAKPQPNYLYTIESWDNTSPTRAIPSDYSLTGHWNLEKIKAPEAWKELGGCVSDNTCTGDSDVIIAVLDTGVAYENYTYFVGSDQDRDYYLNPEFSNVNFVGGYDAYQDYYCYYYGCTTEEADKINHANDDHGHGTAVTSIIASNIGDASPNKMVGIANGVSLMPVKISIPNDGDTGSGQSNSFLMSIALDYARENGADIVNISFGGSEYDSYIEDAVNEAYNAGMVIVAASGNENSSVIYPAAFANVIAVGASNELDLRASYSNYGPELDLVAPVGGGIYLSSMACYINSTCFSTTVLDTFSSPSAPINNKGGTSFAAPQVAAAAGLLKSQNSTLSNDQINYKLISTTKDIMNSGKDDYTGFGLLQTDGLLLPDPTPTPTSIPTPASKYYFSLYSNKGNPNNTWIEISNPTDTDTNVNLNIGNVYNQNYPLPAHTRITPYIEGVHAGPVTVTSADASIPLMVNKRELWGPNMLVDTNSIPENKLATKYFFSLYSNKGTPNYTWLEITNPSETQTAYVSLKIGINTYGNNNEAFNGSNPYIVGPQQRVTVYLPGVHDGPVDVSSLNFVPLIVGKRELWNSGALSEVNAVPQSDVDTKYYFSIYANKNNPDSSWIETTNISDLYTAEVKITIGTVTYGANNEVYNGSNPYIIAPRTRMTTFIAGLHAGPVVVESTNSVPIIVGKRELWTANDLTEENGISAKELTNEYFFPLYSNKGTPNNTWIEISNPSPLVSTVQLSIGTIYYNTIVIPAYSRATPFIPGIHAGPVTIKSDGPNLIVSKRELWGSGSLDESNAMRRY